MPSAQELEKQAKQLSTKSLLAFRFSVDHDQAGITFDKAAHLYKAQSKLSDAARCYDLSAREHQKAGNLFHAAKALDNAASAFRDLKDIPKAIKCYKNSSEIMLEDGKMDRAAEILTKGAKLIEKEMTKNSSKLSDEHKNQIKEMYVEALKMYANGDKYHMATNSFRAFNAFLLKNQMYDECIRNIKKQTDGYVALKQMHNVWKNNLSLVVVQLQHDSDSIAAEELHEETLAKFPDYSATKECQLATQFIQAFEQNDQELLDSTIQDRDLKYLEAQVSKICRKMTLDRRSTTTTSAPRQKVKISKVKQQTEELLGGADEDDNEEEEEEDLDSLYEDDEPDALDEDNLC
uniref:Gamma-soluble NSF attachment protein n=1 Tax=Percolomonas cosmopolitus TaxID=63605 RepID=A0A7S1PJP6_9EUKA|mmetsp:Transcript_9988/g.37244  ORF Transcript_9988/g.37244 Transcript_9988/m.37244 type:complete len:348 (+) Transcript_9988:75-1118(+)